MQPSGREEISMSTAVPDQIPPPSAAVALVFSMFFFWYSGVGVG